MVSVIDTIKPAGNFAVAEAPDIQVGDKRLDEVLDGKAKSSDVAALQSGKVDKVAGKGLSTNDYSVLSQQYQNLTNILHIQNEVIEYGKTTCKF